MNRTPAFLMSLRFLALSGSIAWAFLNAAQAGVSFAKGDLVRTQRGEMLQFKGEDLVPAGKGQEFTVLAHESVRGVVYVGYTKEDGTLIAASLPAEIVTPAPRDGWQDLFQGMEAFREQRYEEAKKLLGKASQDSQHRVLASGLALRVNALLTAAGQALSADPDRKSAGARIFLNAFQGMRELSGQLSQAKHYSLAGRRRTPCCAGAGCRGRRGTARHQSGPSGSSATSEHGRPGPGAVSAGGPPQAAARSLQRNWRGFGRGPDAPGI
jgi:hypothetical protein